MNKFLPAVCAAILLSTTALAGEKQVEVEIPKTITVTCSDNVRPGTVVLSNPPKFSCADYDVVNRVIGTGITVGPNVNISRILQAIRRVERPSRRTAETARNDSWNSKEYNPPSYWQDGYRKGAWQPLDDFDKRFRGMHRNRAWFEKNENTNCTGYVSLSELLSNKCKGARIKVN